MYSEKQKNIQKKYRETHKEMIKVKRNKRYASYPLKYGKIYHRTWRKNNPSKVKAYVLKYSKSNRDKLKEKTHLYRLKNPDKTRKYISALESRRKSFILKNLCSICGNKLYKSSKWFCAKCYKKQVAIRYASKYKAFQKISKSAVPYCINCKEQDIRILTINHKNGRKHDVIKRTGAVFYNSIINGIRNIRDLEIRCYNCNILYEFEIRKTRIFPKDELEEYLKNHHIIPENIFLKIKEKGKAD